MNYISRELVNLFIPENHRCRLISWRALFLGELDQFALTTVGTTALFRSPTNNLCKFITPARCTNLDSKQGAGMCAKMKQWNNADQSSSVIVNNILQQHNFKRVYSNQIVT
ncbi:Hypothetical_protein [Hexamita inflata]|uniref:Hypothetical_protein n=1 Tax=Hexamita inflata TaxID=28002 RepID=A0ABP1GHA7_9EUKA